MVAPRSGIGHGIRTAWDSFHEVVNVARPFDAPKGSVRRADWQALPKTASRAKVVEKRVGIVCDSMTLDELIAGVRKRGLIPVRLASDPSDDDAAYWPFDGSLDDFLDTVQALGARAVYVAAGKFATEHFQFEAEPDEDLDDEGDEDNTENEEQEDADEERGDDAPVDLVALEPRLLPFKEHIGEHCWLSAFVSTGDVMLRVDHFATWFTDFESLRNPVIDRLEASAQERHEAYEAQRTRLQDEKRAALLQQLDALPDDRDFHALPSKAAMTAYVAERFPASKEVLDAREFREKLTELHQRAQLKRPRKERK